MILLGSTGSIGVNTLKIAKEFDLEVEMLVCGENIALLRKQIEQFHPRIVVTAKRVDIDAPLYFWGEEGILRALEEAKSPLVVNALVGFLGLKPTIKAIELGKRVALANKESLVAAGKFIDMDKITPIDSEHFGLWYLLQGRKDFRKLLITASGGAFRDWDIEKMRHATLQDALRHPNWSMGRKITIDSATMVNKLFEILEAYWLFGSSNIDALIETRSVIHAMVEFVDGSTTMHASEADMRLPIAFALLGEVKKEIVKPIDFVRIGNIEFRSIDPKRYPVWKIKDALLQKPHLGVVVNAANEAAIELFIEEKIAFMQISELILQAFEAFEDMNMENLEDIFAIDEEVRRFVQKESGDFKYRK